MAIAVEKGEERIRLGLGIRASSQNLIIEIEAMERDLELFPDTPQNRPTIRTCRESLVQIRRAANSWLRGARSYYIFTSLHWINEKLFEIRDMSQLYQQWLILRDRLYQFSDEERGKWSKERLDEIDKAFQRSPKEDRLKALRSELFALRKLIDQKVALSLWGITQTNASILALTPVLVSLFAGVVAFVGYFHEGSKTIEMLDTILVSSLGATVSTLMSLLHRQDYTAPSLINHSIINLLRPLIGAVAGLFFYFLLQFLLSGIDGLPTGAGVANKKILFLYGLAFVFGFSERLFRGSVEAVAKSVESKVMTYGARKKGDA